MKMFYLGMLTTLGILGILFVLYNLVLRINSKRQLKKRFENELKKDELSKDINKIIHEARKKALLENKETTLEGNFQKFKELSFDIAKHISKKYNPKSKYPHYELTFYELLKLNSEIINFFLDSLENKDEIKYLKDIKICHLMRLVDAKEEIGEMVNKNSSKIEAGKTLVNATSFCMNPINKIQNTVISKIFEKGGQLILETSLKTSVLYGVTKVGIELDKIYGGHYLRKNTLNKKN
ncbi:MAG: hypothetical protein ACRCZ2_13495 [Fusobacteriaceae bacterium]